MAIETKISGANLTTPLGLSPQNDAARNNKDMGKTEFLQLLITQLKNQDPMNPMENNEFAVQLAQFSQLEQLIDINNKTGSDSDMSSMASYLGHEVVLNSSQVTVANGESGSVSFELGSAVSGIKVELLDQYQGVVASHELGNMGAGRHSVPLDALQAPNGEYTARVVATGLDGSEYEVTGYAGGVVSGFIPGPDPALIVNGREISTADIREVKTASSAS